MPYRHAHWFLLALFPLAALAFWPGYLASLTTASMEFHAHGVTATAWLLLLVAQSWTIHHGQRGAHRALGTASLALFPLFLAGGASIFLGMAHRYVEGASPFHLLYAPRLAWLDVVGVAGIAWFYYQALRWRRKVHVHSRYLLATAIFLLPPILARLSPILPPLAISGPQDLGKLMIGLHLANGLTAAIAFTLAVRSGPHGRPFYIAGWLSLLGSLLYQTVGGMAWWHSLFARAAELPSPPFALAAGLGGAAIGYAGWVAGRTARPQTDALPA